MHPTRTHFLGKAALHLVLACCLATVGALIAYPILPATAQSSLDGFNPTFNSQVLAIALQPDGKILVGGIFTLVNGQPHGRLARLLPDGSLDPAFSSSDFNHAIFAVAVQPDGKILVGGIFTTFGATSRPYLARLQPDGSLDTTFQPDISWLVYALAIQPDGKILIGGNFTSVGGVARKRIARLNPDGSLDSSFDPGLGANGIVYTLALDPLGRIIVGGDYSLFNGENHPYLVRLNANGSLDSTFNVTLAGGGVTQVLAVALQPDGKIVLGGEFTTVNGESRNYIARVHTNGALDTTFDPNANDVVLALAIQPDGKILLAGRFATVGGVAHGHIARLQPDGVQESSFSPEADSPVNSLALQADGKILIGGDFLYVDGEAHHRLARLHSIGKLDRHFNCDAGNTVTALALQPDGKILVGGSFGTLCGSEFNSNLGRLFPDSSLEMLFMPGANDSVNAVVVQPDGKILIAGAFTKVGGITRNRIARLNADGSLDTTFDPGTGANASIYALAVQPDGKILVGGAFTTLRGQPRTYLGRLNANGTLDTTFTPDPNGVVYTLLLQPDNRIVVGGNFSSISGQPRSRIARLRDSGGIDTTLNPQLGANGTVRVLALQADGKIILGGDFTYLIYGTLFLARNRLARLNPDGNADSFNPNANATVYALAIQQDGKILVGGDFTLLGDGLCGRIARLETSGSLDPTFDCTPGADGSVRALALQPDGRLLVGGNFGALAGQPRSRLGRLTAEIPGWQALSATVNSISWQRSGVGPELWRVTLEKSTNGLTYTWIGEATRLNGGWIYNSPSLGLPQGQNVYLRLRGYYPTGSYNGSGSLLEVKQLVYLNYTSFIPLTQK